MTAHLHERSEVIETSAHLKLSRRGSWRVPLRMARRTAWREKGRALLVITMIALPVGAVSAISIAVSTESSTQIRAARLALGGADLRLQWVGYAVEGQTIFGGNLAQGPELPGPASMSPAARLPFGSRVVAQRSGTGTVTFNGRPFREVSLNELDFADPIFVGTQQVINGRLPARSDEVAVTQKLAARLEIASGATLTLANGTRTITVVGVVESTSQVDHQGVLLGFPGSLQIPIDRGETPVWFATTPHDLSIAELTALNAKGWVVVSKTLLNQPPAWCTDRSSPCYGTRDWSTPTEEFSYQPASFDNGTATVIALATVMALLQVVLLIGPAFAVGLRRRRRDLGLLAVTGARPAQLRRVVLAEGLLLGIIGALSGVVLAWVLVWRLSHLLERTGDIRWVGLPSTSPLVTIAVLIGVLTAIVAALAPARQAAKTDAASAVGRGSVRAATRRSRRWVVIGGIIAVVFGSGLVIALALRSQGLSSTPVKIVLLSALIVAELGVVTLSPTLVALIAGSASRLPLTPRLAARDAARNRLRSGAAVAAVTAAVAGSVTSLLYFASIDAVAAKHYHPTMRPNLLTTDLLPGTTAEELSSVQATLRRTLPVLKSWSLAQLPAAPPAQISVGIEIVIPPALRCPAEAFTATDADRMNAETDPRCTDPRRRATYGVLGRYVDILVADADALATITGVDSGAARAALDAGGAVVFSKYLLDGDRITLTSWQGEDGKAIATSHKTVTVPGVLVADGPVPAMIVVSPIFAKQSGIAASDDFILATTSRTPTVAEADAANAALARTNGGENSNVRYEIGRQHTTKYYLLFGIVAIAVLIGAAASISAAGLALTDSKADLSTLAAVGAPPRVRRRLAAWQAGVLAILGSTLGLAAGFLPGWAMVHLTTDQQVDGSVEPITLVIPWWPILAIAIGLPLLTSAVVWLAVRSRVVLVRRTD